MGDISQPIFLLVSSWLPFTACCVFSVSVLSFVPDPSFLRQSSRIIPISRQPGSHRTVRGSLCFPASRLTRFPCSREEWFLCVWSFSFHKLTVGAGQGGSWKEEEGTAAVTSPLYRLSYQRACRGYPHLSPGVRLPSRGCLARGSACRLIPQLRPSGACGTLGLHFPHFQSTFSKKFTNCRVWWLQPIDLCFA